MTILDFDFRNPRIITKKFDDSLKSFYLERPSFKESIGERVLAFRLGIYLDPLFRGLNVDGEYNRNMTDSKRIHELESVNLTQNELKFLSLPKVTDLQADSVYTTHPYKPKNYIATPDIIVHRRGSGEFNTLAIEVKKFKGVRADYIYHDLKRLKEFTRTDGHLILPYRYTVGIFLSFHPYDIDKTKYLVFTKGKIFEDLSKW